MKYQYFDVEIPAFLASWQDASGEYNSENPSSVLYLEDGFRITVYVTAPQNRDERAPFEIYITDEAGNTGAGTEASTEAEAIRAIEYFKANRRTINTFNADGWKESK